MKSYFLIIFQMAVLFCSGSAYAQSVDATQINLDKKFAKAVVNEKGEVVFVFHDGREAQVFYGPSASLKGQIKLQQLENSCEYNLKPANCVVEGFFQNYKIQLQWTKHPNPKKIGGGVEKFYGKNNPAAPVPMQQGVLVSDLAFSQIFKDKPVDFPAYRISCDQTEWMEKARMSEKSVLFSSLSAELMFENSETDVNENQTYSEIYNARFDLIAPNKYKLHSHQYSSALATELDPFLSNQVVHFVYQEKQKSCHVGFAANAGELLGKLSEMDENVKPIINKKLLKSIGNSANSEFIYLIHDLLRSDRDSNPGVEYR